MSENSDAVFNTDSISKNKLQELNDLFMLIKKEKLKFVKSDIFLDTVLESAFRSYGIKEMLAVKIKDIILRGELIYDLQVKDENVSGSQVSLLDKFNNIELSFEEQKDLKIAVEQRIKEKNDIVLKEMNEITDNDAKCLQEIINRVKFDAETEKNNLITWQRKLTEQQKLHVNSLLDLGNKLQELVNLKTVRARDVAEQKTNEISTQCRKFDLRSRIMDQQLRISIFEELPLSIDAYRKALIDLRKQQDEYSKEVERLRLEKENYKLITRNEEFQEILNDYKQYKRSIEKKLWIYNELGKNK